MKPSESAGKNDWSETRGGCTPRQFLCVKAQKAVHYKRLSSIAFCLLFVNARAKNTFWRDWHTSSILGHRPRRKKYARSYDAG